MAGFYSPLRYPGGKSQLASFIKHTMDINNINESIYCEPFSGGAGIAMSLLVNNEVDSIILNDYDPAIYSIWQAIIFESDKFIDCLEVTDVNINTWHEQKDIYTDYMERGINEYSFDIAFAAFFLNRTNRSGIINGSGPIGGYSQKSNYDIGCRFNKNRLIKKIKAIAEKKDFIRLFNMNAIDLIRDVLLQEDENRLFTYFDPPYYTQGKKLYKNSFDDDDHIALAQAIRLMNDYHWIATYDNINRIREIYNDRNILEYTIMYSANRKRYEKELMFYSLHTNVESFGTVEFV